MKRLFVFASLLWLLTNISCKKKNNSSPNATFDTEYNFDVTIPAQTTIPPIDTTIIVHADIDLNDSRLDQCESATLNAFNVTITSPSSQTFDFCNEIRLIVSADGVPETEVLVAANVNPSANRIDFTVNSINLAAFLKKQHITAKLRVKLTQKTLPEVRCHGNLNFKVKVTS
jgi:hypothetical protein